MIVFDFIKRRVFRRAVVLDLDALADPSEKSYLVGELGPELLTLPEGVFFIPHSELEKIAKKESPSLKNVDAIINQTPVDAAALAQYLSAVTRGKNPRIVITWDSTGDRDRNMALADKIADFAMELLDAYSPDVSVNLGKEDK